MEKKSGKKSGEVKSGRLKQPNLKSGQETGSKHHSNNLAFGDINFQALIENAPDGIALISREGKFKYASSAAFRIFGYSSEDMIDPELLTHPDDLQKVIQTINEISADPSRVIKIQYRFRSKDGTWRWIESIFSNMLSKPGVESIVINFRDISELIKASKEVKESEFRLRELIDNVDGLVWAVDMDNRLITCNSAFQAKIRDFSGHEIKNGENFLELPGASRKHTKEWMAYLKRAKQGEQFTIERKNDAETEGSTDEITFRPVFSLQNEVIGIAIVKRDITKRKMAEDTLKQSEERFRMLLEMATDAFFQGNSKGDLLLVNNKATELTGYSREELLEMNLNALFPLHELQSKPLNYQKLNQGQNLCVERILRRKDNSEVYIEMHSRAMPDGTYQSFFRDITDRKLAEKELEKQKIFFEQMFLQSATSTQILDPEGWCTRINSKLSEIFGVLPEHIEGKVYNIFQDEEIKKNGIDKLLHNVFNEHTIEQWEVFFDIGSASDSLGIDVKEKKKVWFANKAYPILDSKGNLMNVIVQHEDISERKRAEEALRIKEEQLLTLINTTNDIICFKDGEGKWLQANDADLELFGLTGIDYYLKKDSELAEHAHEKYFDAFMNCEKTDETAWQKCELSVAEEIIPTMDGKERTYEVIKTPLFNVDGSRRGLVVFGRDITRHKAAEIALKESELKYRQIVDYSPDGIIIHSGNRVIFANPAALQLIGVESLEMLGERKVLDFVHPDFRSKAIQRIKDVMEKGIAAGFIEEKFLKINGEVIDVEVMSIPVQYMGRKANQVIFRDISERKLAVEALKESEDKFRTLAESSPYAIMIYQDDHWIYANPAGERLSGYPADELYKMNFWDLATDEYRELIRARGKSRQVGQAATPAYEFKICTKSGEEKWVYLSGSSLLYKGRYAGIVSVIDITGRKQTEEAIHREQLILRTLIDNLPDTIYFKDTAGRKIVANRADLELMGLSEESEALGKTDLDMLGKESGLAGYNDDMRVIHTGMPLINIENEVTGADGKQHWLMTSKIPLHDENGKVNGLVGIGHDITLRKRAEQIQWVLLKISNAVMVTDELDQLFEKIRTLLGTLLDTTNFYIAFFDESDETLSIPYLKDEKDNIVQWPAGKSATGYVIKNKRSLLIDKDDIDMLNQQGVIEIIGEPCLMWLGVPLVVGEKSIGALVIQSYESTSAFSLKDVEMLEFVSRQLSLSIQRKKAEQEIRDALAKAEESDRLKTAFLNNMSHEIRTPLNGILGFTSLLDDPDTTEEDQKYFYRIINQNGEQLLSIINDIISIATIEAGQEKVREANTNVNEMLHMLYGQFKLQSTGKQLMLNYRTFIRNEDSVIKTDETKLRQVLTNLIGNALKFTEQGMVEFGCNQDGDMLKFFVTDTGIGIPAEMHRIIFDRFRQASDNPRKEYGGNGLGLAISKAYVELLGGNIWLESTPGKGTTFWFTIPFNTIQKNKIPGVPAGIRLSEAKGKGRTLLVAEDVYANYQLLEAILRKMNFGIIHVENGVEAVEACKNHPEIDLVLMDMKMPEMDGYEATGHIKKLRPRLPVIAVTAYALSGDKEKALRAGCDDYISKPVKAGILVEILNRFLNPMKKK
ncbi:MAG: PAS domain S-box protein [Lentimicrobium sp.]